jgi:hypothetical protein
MNSALATAIGKYTSTATPKRKKKKKKVSRSSKTAY